MCIWYEDTVYLELMFLTLFKKSPVAPQSFSHHSGAVHQPQPSSTPTGNQPPPQHAAPSPGQVRGQPVGLPSLGLDDKWRGKMVLYFNHSQIQLHCRGCFK